MQLPAGAQNYPNGLSADSIHPEADSVFIARMRKKLDRIRKTEHRPTVALVLSGGGAKGAAEAGALQYLEDNGIPVDMVCGTSIGGLLGALYSIGYTSADMRELFCTQDWGVTLTDRVSPEHIPYETKLRRQKYVVNIPFHYAKDKSPDRRKNPDFSAEDGINGEAMTTNITKSLPTGYSNGFNINNLFSSLTVGYQDSISFTELPVPYMCVATDMVSCKANNWTSGDLKTAMRSTMSIPGLFNPVRTEGMVLVDGGTRNNYPADVARACGADYIIGIELANAEPDYGEVDRLGTLVGQFIRMLGKDAYDKNIGYPDVRVRPDMNGFSMLSFNAEAVDTMMLRGYEAIALKSEELKTIKAAVGDVKPRNVRKAINLAVQDVLIGDIGFEGINDKEAVILMDKIGLVAGQRVNKAIMDEAMSRIQATGAFESVKYSLHGEADPFNLVITCEKGATNVISMGFRIDQEEWAAIMFDLGINRRKLQGSKFDFSARLGRVQKLNARYSLDLPKFPTFNAELGFNHCMNDIVGNDGEVMTKGTWEHVHAYSKFYFSKMAWSRVAFKLGAQYRYYAINTDRDTGRLIAVLFPDDAECGYSGLFADAKLYTLDDMYYPSKGMDLSVGADWDVAKTGYPNFNPYFSLYGDFRFVIPLGKVFAIVPDIHFRGNHNDSNSYFHLNFAGGNIAGRYIDQQIPLVGTVNMHNMRNQLFVTNLDFRFKLPKDFYLSARAGYANDGDKLGDLITDMAPSAFGFELQGGYDSVAGPLKLSLLWSNISSWGVAFSLGFDF